MKHVKTINLIKISLSTSLALLLVNLFLPFNAFADTMDYQVYVKPSLNLTLSSNNLTLNLNPADHAFDHINLDTTVATNNPNGYKLYLNTTTGSGSDNGTELVNTINSSYTIPTLLSSITESSFPANYWGYRLNPNTTTNTTDASTTNTNTEYLPYTPNTLISQSPTNSNGISSTIDFAAKIDYNKPAGTYNIAFNLQALPQVTQYYMQDLVNTAEDPNLTTRVCTETPTMVMDKRDGHTYAIARLKDGKCWMVQNLRLGENTESIALTAEDSNVPASGFVLDGKLADGKFTVTDDSSFYCTAAYGCYYNWYTATAGSGTTSISVDGDSAASSICSANWRLPSQTEWESFATAYNWSFTGVLVEMPFATTENINGASVPGLLLGGNYLPGGANLVGIDGTYWSRTTKTDQESYDFYLSSSQQQVHPRSHYAKRLGFSVRCLLQE